MHTQRHIGEHLFTQDTIKSVSTVEILLTKPAPVTAILFGAFSASGGAAQYKVTDRYVSPPELVVGDAVGYMPVSLAANAHMSGSQKVFWNARGADVDQMRESMGWPLRGRDGSDDHEFHEPSQRDDIDHNDTSTKRNNADLNYGNESSKSDDVADKIMSDANRARDTRQSSGAVVYASPQYFALEPKCLSTWVRAAATCAGHVNVTLAVTVNAYAHVSMVYINERARQCGVTLRWHQRVLSDYEYLRRASAADLYGMFLCVYAYDVWYFVHVHVHVYIYVRDLSRNISRYFSVVI
jgi:hypothetical protein